MSFHPKEGLVMYEMKRMGRRAAGVVALGLAALPWAARRFASQCSSGRTPPVFEMLSKVE